MEQEQPNQGQSSEPSTPPTPPVKPSRYPFGEDQKSGGPPSQPPQTPPNAPPSVPPAQQQPEQSQPAPQKTETWKSALTIILLIIFPIIGLILMWFITNWSKTVKWIITILGILIMVIVVPIILLSVLTIGSLGESRSKGFDARVASDLNSLQPPLEMHRGNTMKYPVTDSFSEMSSELIGVDYLDSEPQEPSSSYHYTYCSTNGSAYKLEVEQLSTKDSFTLGTDTCQPGE